MSLHQPQQPQHDSWHWPLVHYGTPAREGSFEEQENVIVHYLNSTLIQ